MVQRSVIDTAGRISMTLEPVRDQSDPRRGVVITHDRDSARPHVRVFSLTWAPAMWAQVKAIRNHFADNPGSFTLNHPNGTAYSVTYRSGPQIRARSANSATVSVQLVEAFATDL